MLEVLMVTMMRWSDHHGSNPAVCFSWSDFNDFLMCEIRSLSYCTPTLKWAIFHGFIHGSSHCLKTVLKCLRKMQTHFTPILMHFTLILVHSSRIFDAFYPHFWRIFTENWCISHSFLIHFTLSFDEFYPHFDAFLIV